MTAPAAEPLSLADAKVFLRVEHDADDAIITSLIASARNHVEALTCCGLITQTWRIALQRWWRPLYAFELTAECAALWALLIHGFWIKDLTAINTMIGATGLLVSYWGFRFGVLGVYFSGRTREKMSLATGQDTPGVLDKLINKVVKKK